MVVSCGVSLQVTGLHPLVAIDRVTKQVFVGWQCQAEGHRAFFKEVLEIIKCHQDVLHGNSRGLLLKYVAIYAPIPTALRGNG